MLIKNVSEYLSNIKARVKKSVSVDGYLGYLLRRMVEVFLGKNSSYKINDLSEWLELPVLALKSWLNGIPSEYKYENFKIPKKSGRGRRDINAPNPGLSSTTKCLSQTSKETSFTSGSDSLYPW